MNGSGPIAFHHVSSVVTDLDRSVAFYSGLLGLEVRSRTRCEMGRLRVAETGADWPGSGEDWPTEPVEVALLELNGVRVELAQPLETGAAPDAISASSRSLASTGHVALKVGDIARLRRDLEAAGVQFLTPLLVFPEEGHRPWIWCRCADPDGHQVELVEEMPTSYQLERMAERLREARAQRGRTLKEVAAQSSISVAHLSQVERGETVPSVPTLLSISSALGVAPDYFFRVSPDDGLTRANTSLARAEPSRPEESAGASASPAYRQPVYQVAQGAIDWHWLTTPDAPVRFARVLYEAGSAAYVPAEASAGQVSVTVLEGTLSAEGGSNRTLLAAGSSLSYDLSTPHRFSNAGDLPAVGIWGVCEQQNGQGSIRRNT